MGVVYHGSKERGLKRVEPRKSTHGVYVYATDDKFLALHFSKRCGDDLTYDIGHFDNDENGPWELVENVPGAFEKMYANSSSIYTLSDETFKDIHTGFEEVVSSVGVDVIEEKYCENVYEGILAAEKEGLVKIYRYPDKPKSLKKDGSDILDKWRYYKNNLKMEFGKDNFDRLVYFYPSLINKINELIKEFNLDFSYEPKDLVDIFANRIQRQLRDLEHEQYIDCAYIGIVRAFPELKEQLDSLMEYYKNAIKKDDVPFKL